jgi:hypothetical protein
MTDVSPATHWTERGSAMAYLDVRDTAVAPIIAQSHAGAVSAPGFARSEWQVIVLAQKDDLASLREPSRTRKLLDRLFGGTFNPRLADPRLETLRRLAVFAWHHGYAVPKSAMKAFLAQGFSMEQLDLLLASVAGGRARHDAHRSATF